jgi:RNA polymerase sigma factor (sigma-70 family)
VRFFLQAECDTCRVEVLTSGPAAQPPVEALYRRYARDVFALAYHAVGSRADAEDLAQTTFLNAHRALMHGAQPTNERAWLLTIARNACCSRFRTLARRPREEPLDDLSLAARTPAEESASPVVDALHLLPPRQRTALVLHAEGRTVAEIGERLGLGVPAADALLFRARAALRDELEASEEPLECGGTEALVNLQLAHELPTHKQAVLRAHLRACSPCARTARRLRARRRLASLLLMPWELLSRVGGLFGQGATGVKAASVAVALVVGATAAVDRGPVGDEAEAPTVARLSAVASAVRFSAPPVVPTRSAPRPSVTHAHARPAARGEPTPAPPAPPAPSAGTPPPSADAPPPWTGTPPPASEASAPQPAAGTTPATADAPARTSKSLPATPPPAAAIVDVVDQTLGTIEGTAADAVAALPELPPVLPPLPSPQSVNEIPSTLTETLPTLPPLPSAPLPPLG